MSRTQHVWSPAREMVLAGSFAALGVVLPILFHMVGMGRHFLPMHLPVLLAGLVLSPRVAWTVGIVTPWLSSMLTGMPPMPFPVLMSIELTVLAELSSVLVNLRVPVWLSAITAVLGRCAVTWVATVALASYLGIPPQAAGWASVAAGLPGIAIQVLAAPVLAMSLTKRERNPATAA